MMKSNESGCEVLLGAGFFEIENLALHFRERGQLLHRAGEEARGDVGERVGVQAALEQRQHLRGSGRRCRAPISRMRRPRPSGRWRAASCTARGDRRQPVAGEEAVAVELIEQLRARAGEEHLHGVLFAAQDRAEFGAIAGAEQRLGQMAGVLRDEGRAALPAPNPPRRRRPASGGSRRRLRAVSATALRELGHQALEDRLHRRGDAQRVGGELLRRRRRPFRASRGRAARR